MDRALKQRLIGAVVLIALAVAFLPVLVKGPAPSSSASDVSMQVPNAPQDGFETRDLPLNAPAGVDANGALGMSGNAPAPIAEPVQPEPAASVSAGPATAAGDYAVHFGNYGNRSDADRVVAALDKAGLRAYVEPVNLSGRSASGVRIGPFESRAAAEQARLAAKAVSPSVKANVITLDANAPAEAPTPAAAPAPVAVAAAPAPKPITTQPLPEAPKPAAVAEAPKPAKPAPAPAVAKPTVAAAEPAKVEAPKPAAKPAASGTGFAVQLGAFSSAAEATALRDKARANGLSAFTETVKTSSGTLTRVRVGPVADRAEAERLQASAQSKLGVSGMVRPHP